MRYVAAYLLATLGGNENPSSDNIKSILKSVGIECDDARIKALLSQTSGKSAESIIAEGLGKLASMPAGGSGKAAAAAPAATSGGSAPAAAAAPKKEEKKEESDEEMGFGLFD